MQKVVEISWKTIIVTVLLAIALAYIFDVSPELHFRPHNGIEITYADLAVVVLTCVAVLVTVLGVWIAVLALWGYNELKNAAIKNAETRVTEWLKDGSNIMSLLETRVGEVLYKEVSGEGTNNEKWPVQNNNGTEE